MGAGADHLKTPPWRETKNKFKRSGGAPEHGLLTGGEKEVLVGEDPRLGHYSAIS